MKGYLFGLGAMVVGAGLMFVLMHGEVSADVQDEYPTCEAFEIPPFDKTKPYQRSLYLTYCKIKDLTCVEGGLINSKTLSCVKTKGGIFR